MMLSSFLPPVLREGIVTGTPLRGAVGVPGEEGPGDGAGLGEAPGALGHALAIGFASVLVGHQVDGKPFAQAGAGALPLACSLPFWPSVTSKVTASPSLRVLKPDILISEKWTKRSSPSFWEMLSLAPESLASVLQVSGVDPHLTEYIARSLMLSGRYHGEAGRADMAGTKVAPYGNDDSRNCLSYG